MHNFLTKSLLSKIFKN